MVKIQVLNEELEEGIYTKMSLYRNDNINVNNRKQLGTLF